MKVFFTVLVILFCASCRHNPPMVNTISNANTTSIPRSIEDRRIYLDPLFGNTLACEEVRESTTNDGFKRIQVFFKNYADVPIRFNYRFNWYDMYGVEISSTDNDMWMKHTVLPGDDVTLTSIAPKKNCGDFKVRLINY